MYDARTNLARDVADEVRTHFPERDHRDHGAALRARVRGPELWPDCHDPRPPLPGAVAYLAIARTSPNARPRRKHCEHPQARTGPGPRRPHPHRPRRPPRRPNAAPRPHEPTVRGTCSLAATPRAPSEVPRRAACCPCPERALRTSTPRASCPTRASRARCSTRTRSRNSSGSIKEIGVLQPIVVRPNPNGAGYELIMGERRLRATREAGLDAIPAIIRDTEDTDMLRDALVENLHRSQLNPLEEAAAYQQLIDDFELTHEQLAERISRSRPQISNTLAPAQAAAGGADAGRGGSVERGPRPCAARAARRRGDGPPRSAHRRRGTVRARHGGGRVRSASRHRSPRRGSVRPGGAQRRWTSSPRGWATTSTPGSRCSWAAPRARSRSSSRRSRTSTGSSPSSTPRIQASSARSPATRLRGAVPASCVKNLAVERRRGRGPAAATALGEERRLGQARRDVDVEHVDHALFRRRSCRCATGRESQLAVTRRARSEPRRRPSRRRGERARSTRRGRGCSERRSRTGPSHTISTPGSARASSPSPNTETATSVPDDGPSRSSPCRRTRSSGPSACARSSWRVTSVTPRAEPPRAGLTTTGRPKRVSDRGQHLVGAHLAEQRLGKRHVVRGGDAGSRRAPPWRRA